MQNFIRIVSLLCIAFILFSCKQESNVKQVDFYHWRANYSLPANASTLLQRAESKRLYLRFFDVDYIEKQSKIFPKATLLIPEDTKITSVQEVVPVVYITNRVFEHAKTSAAINALAIQVADKINRLLAKDFFAKVSVPEIQIDCDWTLSTRASYFKFLEVLKQKSVFIAPNRKLSVTLRLHQIKYAEKTGVPPTDIGVLMLYNMGDLGDINEPNSILNLETTKKYLGNLNRYPLPLTMAFPYYDWAVLYREDKLAGIINYFTEEMLVQNFKKTATPTMYRATKDAYLNGNFIYANDVIRYESVQLSELKQLKQLIDRKYAKNYSVILYHVNALLFQNQSTDELFKIFGK